MTSEGRKHEEPTDEQKAAIKSRDKEILIEAGAGTGKTSTTIARYRRILGEGHEPGEILVFTFTDKAAAELRNRVRETSLGEPTVAMGSAWIGTFHSICSRILRSHPVAADVDPRFDVLDDVKGRRIRDEAFESALRKVSADRESAEHLSRTWLPSWKSGVTAVYDQLRARGEERPRLPTAPAGDEFSVVCHRLVDDLLDAYGSEYSKVKRAEGLLDYEDLQLQTLNLLDKYPGIKAAYEDRFVEIMVDEFQDTNRLQVRLIETLQGERTTLFTVGDEMQAIYGFRYADVRLFRQRRGKVGLPLGLTANFRSQAQVIGAVNLIGRELDAQVSSRRTEEQGKGESEVGPGTDAEAEAAAEAAAGRQKFKDLRVGLNTDPGKGSNVEIILVEADGWKGEDLGPISPPEAKGQGAAAAAARAEALAVARRIRGAIDDGEVDASQVALLFRTKSNMPVHAEALAHHGLHPYVVGRTDFWASREAVDVRALLAVVANPLDDESLLSPLFGPACGLSPDAVVLLRAASGGRPLWPALNDAADGSLKGFPDEDRERAREFVDAINAVREPLATTPLGEVVEALVTGTGYDLACLARGRGDEGVANLRRIVSLAAEYEESEGRDLRGFLRWAQDSSDLEAESGVATQEESGEVVRLMTIHKAKGLEFDMVCVPDLGKGRKTPSADICWLGPEDADEGPTGSEADQTVRFGLKLKDEDGEDRPLYDWSLIKENAKTEQEDEELRLFHVAMTRARRLLVLSGIHPLEDKGADVNENTIGRLFRWAVRDGELRDSIPVPAPEAGVSLDQDPVDSEIAVKEIRATPSNAEGLREGREATAGDAGRPAGRPPLRRPRRSRRPDVPLSFTTLSVLKDCPARFFATQVLKLEDPETDWRAHSDPEPGEQVVLDPEEHSPLTVREATAFGSAVHEVLEACAKRRWVRPIDAEIAARLELRGLDPADDRILTRATEMIYGFLDSALGRIVSGERCEAEIPLLFDAGGITVRGFADLLAEGASPPLILDYKSNSLEGTSAEEKMQQQYVLQRDLYGLAVADALGAEAVQTAFVFLEDVANPVETWLGPDELTRARSEVDGLVDMIRRGSFFGEPDAAEKPCGDCWACRQLGSRTTGTRSA